MSSVTRWVIAAAIGLWSADGAAQASAGALPEHAAALDARLADEARLEWMTELLLTRAPTLRAAEARSRQSAAAARAAGRLPDTELKYEQWAVPVSRPYDLSRAFMLMWGLKQGFPAPGSRQARTRMAEREAEMAAHQRSAIERDRVRQLRQVFAGYRASESARRIREEHLAIAEQTLAQLRAGYAVGRGSQQAVLKALSELGRLKAEVIELERRHASGRFQLNALMGRATDAPLGPAAEPPAAEDVRARRDELARELASRRPELAAASSATRRAEAAVDEAKAMARRPEVMIGADYMLMPTMEERHAYGAMVSMTLPWLNRGNREAVRAAEQGARAERHAWQAMTDDARRELHEALAGVDAATASLEVLERELLPEAERIVQATRSAFGVGQSDVVALLDALRSYFDMRLQEVEARALVTDRLAELEFASGARVFSTSSAEVRP